METTFTYNPATLTPEQVERINAARNAYNARIAELREEEDRRAEHYYDCLDEYSYGGICSTLNARQQREAEANFNRRVEYIVNGYVRRVRRENILKDLEGNIVARGTREGQYGRYFKTNDGKFVSCTKRVATYEKKGYRPYILTTAEALIPAGNGRWEVKEILAQTEEISTEIAY